MHVVRTVVGGPASFDAAREARLWWPAHDIDGLRAALARLPGHWTSERLSTTALPDDTALGPAVAYLAAEHASYAAAYAASVGGTAHHVRDVGASHGAPLVVGDLLATPRAVVEGLGCTYDDARAGKAVGWLHADEAGVGSLHLLKNLLARLGVFPRHSGRTVLTPMHDRSRALVSDDESFLLGLHEPEIVRAQLARPTGHLMMCTHSSPFESFIGDTVICAGAPGASTGAALPGERVLACMTGGRCQRAVENPAIALCIPPSAISATHILWLGCDSIVCADSVFRSGRALLFQWLGTPDTVSVLGSLQRSRGGAEDLLHACFLLDQPSLSLGEFGAGIAEFMVRLRGAVPGGLMLLGDPAVIVGSGDAGRAVAPAETRDGDVVVRPTRLRERWTVPQGAGWLRPLGTASVVAAAAGDGILELLNSDESGAPPAGELRFATSDPRPAARRQLDLWRRRAGFWRILLVAWRDRLRSRRSEYGELLEQVEKTIVSVTDWEAASEYGAARVERASAMTAEWVEGPTATLSYLSRKLPVLQQQVLEAVANYAGTLDPRVRDDWTRFAVRQGTDDGGRCACGERVEARLWKRGRGVRRLTLHCVRCGPVGDHECPDYRPTLHVRPGPLVAGGELAATLRGVRQGDAPVLVAAALAPEPGADGRLPLVRCALGDVPGELSLVWRLHEGRAAATQPLHVFLLRDLAYHSMTTWVSTEPGGAVGSSPDAAHTPIPDRRVERADA